MGVYLSQPVTEKEVYSGSNKFLEYGGASMQGWRRSMEDAHIAVLDLGNNADMAMFAVFDGHGGSEVAKFCQKYMAAEVTKTKPYSEGKLRESLVEAFHRIDLMLRDEAYHQELTSYRQPPSPIDDPPPPVHEPNPQPEKPQQTWKSNATSEAMQLIRRVLALRKPAPTNPDAASFAGSSSQSDEPGSQPVVSSSEDARQVEENLSADPAVESVTGVVTEQPEAQSSASLRPEASAEPQSQAGCTALVAVFKGDQLFVANAGDSRAVLCRGPEAVPLSFDHKPASDSERQRIEAAGGFLTSVNGVTRVNGNLNLSRAIGDLKYKTNAALPAADQIISAEPDVTQTHLISKDWFLVLACDGVWDVMSNQDAIDFVAQRLQQGLAASEIAAKLLDACLAIHPLETRGIGCDNMTATIVVFRSDTRGEDADGAGQKKCDLE